MSRFKVLLTDYAWPELEIERRTLAEIDAELVVAAEDQQDPASLARLAADVDAIMTNWAKVPAAVIDAAPKCKIVARLGIGLDNIDVAAASRHGMYVTNIPDYCLIEVAEHALALALALGRKVAFYHEQTKRGTYNLKAGPTLRRIEGQTLGIVGLGNIGTALATRAAALGLNVLATSRSRREGPPGVTVCDLDRLLKESDYVSLHVPLAPETKHMIGREQLALMKPTAYLINTARGGLVDHAALAEALAAGTPGRGGARRAGTGAAGFEPAALERPARRRHAARGVRVGRVAGESAHAHFAADRGLSERLRTGACRQRGGATSTLDTVQV